MGESVTTGSKRPPVPELAVRPLDGAWQKGWTLEPKQRPWAEVLKPGARSSRDGCVGRISTTEQTAIVIELSYDISLVRDVSTAETIVRVREPRSHEQAARQGPPPGERERPLKGIDGSARPREKVAKALGVTKASVDRYCRGARTPTLGVALAIEEVTGGAIPARSGVAPLATRHSKPARHVRGTPHDG